MLKFLWHYLRGYITIETKGITKERFLNMVVHKDIRIWDIYYTKGIIVSKISINDFKKLKPLAKKTNIKYKIINKYGAPFFIYKHRKRKILFLGIPLCLMFLYVLTSFVWAISIIGYDKINHDNIINALNENGLTIGSFKHNINKLAIEDKLLEIFNEMSFVNININGTRATVTIAESIPQVEIIDRVTPSNLVSNNYGIVHSVHVSSGEAVVVPGDVVSFGDLLVTGMVVDENVENATHLIHAIAEIYAYVYYNISFTILDEQTTQHLTGNTTSVYSFNFLGYNLTLPSFVQNFQNYDTITSRRFLNFGYYYPLPFALITTTKREYALQTSIITEEQTNEIAIKQINNILTTYFPFAIDIIQKQITKEKTYNGTYINAIITTIQNISKEEEITLLL